jgi:DNA-binding winged helix-turn-helix (wHTH) protein
VIWHFGPHEFDTGLFELRCDGQVVPVERQVFDLLAFLITNRDRVVSQHEILESVWGGRAVTPSALATQVKVARRAIGDDGKRQASIATLHRRGYRFVASVGERPEGGVFGRSDAIAAVASC